jgi:hypothetical protein
LLHINGLFLTSFSFHKRFIFCVFAILLIIEGLAQDPVLRPGSIRRPPTTNSPRTPGTPDTRGGNRGRGDSTVSGVERREYEDDSLQVQVYSLSSVRASTFDTSIRDYTLRFPVPATHVYLGNDGSATRSLLFATPQRTGWDPGFHSHDVYRWKLENTRFYNTPRPYTELGYMLASGQAQMIDILHTQNVRPYWNVAFQYRLFSSPGIFRNLKNNHRNYQISSWYQSPNKRYNNYFVILNNKIQAGESGGIRNDKDYLNDPIYDRRLAVPTNIGGSSSIANDLFASGLNTGRREKDFHVLLRQQYDFGRKDSLVTDTVVIPLFYPRVRFEHSFHYGNYSFLFQDFFSTGNVTNDLDSVYYDRNYGIKLAPNDAHDTLFFQDSWREISNDFSIYQFPDANNLQQFIKLGAELQLLKGNLRNSSPALYNVIAHGEYRNRTKNQKWDINAFGRLHTAGDYAGDYHAYVSLQRLLSQQLGSLQVGFENVNRSPSFIYDQRSSFYLDAPKNFSKENTAHFFAGYYIPKLRLQLNGDYYFISNYLYLNGYRSLQQENAVFNLLRISGKKTFPIGRSWNIHSEVYVQQKAGGAEVNVPLLYTRNMLAYEGRLFRNLNLSAGLEMRYHTPYKADNYSPILGQFFYQDSVTIRNRPDIHAFLHMRIRTFRAYVRMENLNTASFESGFGFKRHNFAAPAYPLPGMVFRFGIYWAFVN